MMLRPLIWEKVRITSVTSALVTLRSMVSPSGIFSPGLGKSLATKLWVGTDGEADLPPAAGRFGAIEIVGAGLGAAGFGAGAGIGAASSLSTAPAGAGLSLGRGSAAGGLEEEGGSGAGRSATVAAGAEPPAPV